MIESIKIEAVLSRVVLASAILICLTATVFFVKWCLGDVIAAQSPFKEVAELSIDLAPSDPQTHYALGVLNEKEFLAEDLAKSVAEFEQATALSPNDFRLWLALGKARERNGDAAGAELALRKSLELAPNYAQVRWSLGNILLRRGKIEEAFAEISRAAESDSTFRLPAITTAWQIFDGDIESVKRSVGSSTKLNSPLAVFLAGQKQFDNAVEIWNAVPAEEKKTTFKVDGESLLNVLLAAQKFRAALQVQKSLDEKPDEDAFAAGKIFNGGFEIDIKREKAEAFDWRIADGAQPQIGFDDAQKIGGIRSLVIVFNSSDGKDFRQFSQMIVVEPAKRYVFEMNYKSSLKTVATLKWEIADAADGKLLATTNPISAEANWTNIKTEFVTGENTEAISLRLVRDACKSIICPITGKVWFDDLLLK